MRQSAPQPRRAKGPGRGDGRGEGAGGILNWFSRNATNAILEGLNTVVQSIKQATRGFRNVSYFETMIFLRLGHLDFSAQTAAACATH